MKWFTCPSCGAGRQVDDRCENTSTEIVECVCGWAGPINRLAIGRPPNGLEPLIIGVDPSLSRTAVVIGRGDEFAVNSYPSSPPTSSSIADRFARYTRTLSPLCDWLESFIGDTPPAVVAIEGYAYGAKHMREYLGEFGGLLRYWLGEFGTPPIEIQPTTLKLFSTGKGNAEKAVVAASLAKRYGVELRTNDEYDAFGVYQIANVVAGLVDPATEYQRRAMKGIAHGQEARK